MNRSRLTALKQSPVLEEHVHELPQHVVVGLGQLLANEGVLTGRRELPLRAGSLRIGERQRTLVSCPGERAQQRWVLFLGAVGDHNITGIHQ